MATPQQASKSRSGVPPAQKALPERFLELAQNLQFAWFLGHLTLLLSTLRYTISFVKFNTSTTSAAIAYRLAFLSAAATYGIVVYKAYRARIKQAGTNRVALQQHFWAMIADENVQYLIMALVWLVSKPIYLALLPFTIYSTFHFLTYLRTALIPTLIPPKPTATGGPPPPNVISDAISKFVKSHYDTSMAVVANLEIALFLRLLGGCLIWVNNWILLALYAVFLRVRAAQSPFVKQALVSGEVRIDGLLADQRVPPAARAVWANIKDGIRKAADMTDLGEMAAKAAGAPGAGRKAQ